MNIIYTVWIKVVLKERIYECLFTDKNVHILLNEQAVYRKCTKKREKKAYLLNVGNIIAKQCLNYSKKRGK